MIGEMRIPRTTGVILSCQLAYDASQVKNGTLRIRDSHGHITNEVFCHLKSLQPGDHGATTLLQWPVGEPLFIDWTLEACHPRKSHYETTQGTLEVPGPSSEEPLLRYRFSIYQRESNLGLFVESR